ncbi:MAG: hypothetical protein JWR83_2783, partial [Aeromicrobium sp.]|nr:hypothetical protein [Aeromicrobium sp.]
KFPLGRRSINKRGQLVAERLAYALAMRAQQPPAGLEEMFAEINHGDQEWYDHGEQLLVSIQAAMHGDADPRALDPDESGQWLAYGRNAEVVEVRMLGAPPLNTWLLDAEAQRAVTAVIHGPPGHMLP